MKLRDYTATAKAALRVPMECSPRIVWKFMYNFGWRNLININRFEKRQAKGEDFFPAFIMISVTESCNLSCSGCWVTTTGKQSLSPEQIDGIISQCKRKGSYFFGILGGEPILHKGLLEVLEKHSDCYFQLFTNGTLITESLALRFKKMGNITPLISIEGLKQESDSRRGRHEVFEKTLAGVRACRKAKLIIGAAASICKSNFHELVNREHLERLAAAGIHYFWYYIYRPVGPSPNPANALDEEEILALRQFIVEQRKNAPLLLIDTYWDDKGNAICPAATGMSHHIAPSGAVEFCPPIQMAREIIDGNASNLIDIFKHSEFLYELRKMTAANSRGCIILEDPEKLLQFLEKHQAKDTTSRQTVVQEYMKMRPVAGHNLKGMEIPEENVIYRIMKKKYFFGFGAYG